MNSTGAHGQPSAFTSGGRIRALLAITSSSSINIQLLIAVIPLASSQVADAAAAGHATVALTGGMVLVQLLMPQLLARFSYRSLMVAGLLLLAVPAVLHVFATDIARLLAFTFVRGLGAGIVTVIWTILIVRYGNPARRGRDFGLFSMATGVIAVGGAPLGLALYSLIGLSRLGLLAGGISLLGAALALATLAEPESLASMPLRGLIVNDWRRIAPPIVVFMATMCGFAAVTSFLPPWSSRLAAPGLLLVGLGSALARVVTGRLTDRFTPTDMLLPALVVSALGMAMISLGVMSAWVAALMLGCLVFGAGVGSLIVSSYLTLIRARTSGIITATASLWNAVYDAGLVIGGLALSPLAAAYGFAWTFVAAAGLLTLLIPTLALYQRRGGSNGAPVSARESEELVLP